MTDTRLSLQDIELRAAMTREQRQKLTEATRLDGKVEALYRAGKYGEAMKPAQRALAIRKEVLSERHALYAESLTYLASHLPDLSTDATGPP